MELLRPTSVLLDDDAEPVRLKAGIGGHGEGVPLQRRDARHLYEHHARWRMGKT